MPIRITGLEQVQRALRELPRLVVFKTFTKALDRAAGVIAAEVEARAPEGEEGLLKESVITQIELDSAGRGGVAQVGFSKTPDERTGVPADLIAFWQEYGHRIVTHKPGKKEVGHVPAKPFMRPAAEASYEKAAEVFADAVIDGLSEVGEI